jgi:hypothetical protein
MSFYRERHGEQHHQARDRDAWYRETLRVPVSYWLLAAPVVALLGAELFVGFSNVVAICVYAVFVLVVGGFLLSWGAVRIEVGGGVLRAGGDTLPLTSIGEAVALDERQAAVLRGPRADPSAHLLLRPYVKKAVYVGLAGSAAGSPYWLVATRRPAELAAALSGSRATVG